MKLRPYQIEAKNAIKETLSQHQSALLVLATGLGKTVVFSHIANEEPDGVLVIAHRKELIEQAAEKLTAITGFEPMIEMGERRAHGRGTLCATEAPIVVASVQSLASDRRLGRFHPEDYSMLIIDEAHHSIASTYRKVISYFKQKNPNISILGVTATPQRGDGVAMGKIFDAVAYDYGIQEAIRDGWLVDIDQQVVEVDGLDLSAVHTSKGDLAEGELDVILNQEQMIHSMVVPALEIAAGRPTLWFLTSVGHAENTADVIDRYAPGSVVALSGKSSDEDRADAVERFRAGKLQHLCNCGLFLEGFDAPNTTVIVMARPTKSLSLYTQVLGRGTRPLPGVVDGRYTADDRRDSIAHSRKPNMVVIDFAGNAGRHKLINSVDVLAGKDLDDRCPGVDADAIIQAAKEYIKANGGKPQEAIDHAIQREMDRRAEAERRKHIKAKRVEYRTKKVSPFDLVADDIHAALRFGPSVPPTPKQVLFLRKHANLDPVTEQTLNRKAASVWIESVLSGWRAKGWKGKNG